MGRWPAAGGPTIGVALYFFRGSAAAGVRGAEAAAVGVDAWGEHTNGGEEGVDVVRSPARQAWGEMMSTPPLEGLAHDGVVD